MIEIKMNTPNLYLSQNTQRQTVTHRLSAVNSLAQMEDSGGMRTREEIKSVSQPNEQSVSQTENPATGNTQNTQNISQNRQEFAESMQSNLESLQNRAMNMSQSGNQSNALKALNTNTNLPDADAYFRKDPLTYQRIQDDILKNEPDYVSNQLNKFSTSSIDVNLKAINSDMQLLKKFMG